MKVGTDGVLLGAWASVDEVTRVLDIGTGTGLIALMLAQRSEASVDAIDIDEGAYSQALDNVNSSPFAERIRLYHAPLSRFALSSIGGYDLIVSNPPYFTDSLKSPDKSRSLARHDDSLTLDELFRLSIPLLTPSGRLALVLPFDKLKELEELSSINHLSILRQTHVCPTPDSAPKRLLVELSRQSLPTPPADRLIIELARHQYSEGYIEMTKGFYLGM